MTIVAGVFQLLDLFPCAEELGGPLELHIVPFEPAWVTAVTGGLPLPYLAVRRMIRGIYKIQNHDGSPGVWQAP